MRLEGMKDRETGWLTRLLFGLLRRREGRVPPPLSLYAYRPAILWSFLRLGRAVRGKGRLDPRLKGLALYWTARNVECRFWIDLTDRLARAAGITAEELAEIADYRQSSRFSPLEQAVLEYAEAMTRTPAEVPEELFSRLAGKLDAAQLVELTAAVALENFSARFNRAFAIEPQPPEGED